MQSNCIHTFECEKKKMPKDTDREQNFAKQTHQSQAKSTAELQLARRDS